MNSENKKGVTVITKAPQNSPLSRTQRLYIMNHYYYTMNFENINTNSDLTETEKSILSIVLTFQIHGQQFYQGVRTIARELGENKYTIHKSIHDLINKGYITCKNLKKRKNTSNVIRRFIYVNLRKALGKPDRTPTKSTRKATSFRNTVSNDKMPSRPPKLTTEQYQSIDKAVNVVKKDSAHSNPIRIKNSFISEYRNHHLKINNLLGALIAYKYDKNVKKKSISSSVGYICSLSYDTYTSKQIKDMKFDIKKQKDPYYDGFDYGDNF